MGTPDFAVPALEAVAGACEVVLVVTRPDRPRGRGQSVSASDVAIEAEKLGLPVARPEKPNAREVREQLEALTPDLFAVVAFGSILSPELLRVPRLGSINLHGSLLPDYRGASPVQRALWDGRAYTGVTTLWMDEGVDTGDMILQRFAPISADDDAASLAERLALLGAPLLAESLTLAHAGRAPRRAQPRGAGSYARKLSKHDGLVDWTADAVTVWNRQRAVTPWPGATTGIQGKRLQILATRPLDMLAHDAAPGSVLEVGQDGVTVACGTGAIVLRSVKPEGRQTMTAAEWARGARVKAADMFHIEKEAHA